MTKYDFIEGLKEALSGEVPQIIMEDNLRYYRDYIESETRLGKNESEVLEALGSPRLIARTIIDAYEAEEGESYQESGQTFYESGQRNQTGRGSDEGRRGGFHVFRANGCSLMFLFLIFIIIIGMVGSMAMRAFMSLPGFVIVLLVVWLIYSNVRRRR